MCNCVPNNAWIPVAFAHESLTVTTAVKTLSASVYNPSTGAFAGQMAVQAFITCETSDIRWWADESGVDPSATVGHVLAAGGTLTLCRSEIVKFEAFLDTAATGDAVISVTYFRPAEP